MTNYPYVESQSWLHREPLKFKTGGEKAATIVVEPSLVELTKGRRILPAGTVLCKVTSGVYADTYGPYTKTATDGRQTLTAGDCFVLVASHDITFGRRAVAGYFQDAVFNLDFVQDSDAAGSEIKKHGTSLVTLKAAFAQCSFM